MNPLRILLDARMVSEKIHGIGRYVVNLAQGLHRAGHQVTILSSHHTTAEIIGVDVVENVIPCILPFAHPMEALELTQVSRRASFDVSHFPSFSMPVILPRNTVVTIHDLIHLYPPNRLAHRLYYNTLVKRALKSCPRVIAVSQWTKNDLIEKLQIPSGNIHVVRNGLEDKWFRPVPSDLGPSDSPSASAAPIPPPYFLCLSNPKAHKNLITLLQACQKLWEEKYEFNLALSLGGNELPENLKFPRGHEHKIRILKNLNETELVSYFAHAQAVVSPSLYEGFDYPAAEGLALNKTVIISRGSAHEELKGSNLHFYSPAKDSGALAAELLKCLKGREINSQEINNQPHHNISTLEEMVRETLKVYQSAK